MNDTSAFKERYNQWKAGKQVYSAGRIIPTYGDGKDDSYLSQAVDFISGNEGFRSNVYDDSITGTKTVGYGFTDKKDLHSWTRDAARERLHLMVTKYDSLLADGRLSEYYKNASDNEKIALIDLLHQGGTGVLDSMPKFVESINSGDYNRAYNEFDFALRLTKTRSNRRRDLFKQGYSNRTAPEVELYVAPQDAILVTRPLLPIRPKLDPITLNIEQSGFKYKLRENSNLRLRLQLYLNPDWGMFLFQPQVNNKQLIMPSR